MKFGVLGFSYANAASLERQWRDTGYYTVNLGDNAQTIAARHVYRGLGVADADMVVIDRDTLPAYDGEAAYLVMNGVFQPISFPVPEQITPILVGVCIKNRKLVARHREWFQRHGPVGCRDLATLEIMRAYEIEAYASGCVTMALPPRAAAPAEGRLLIVHGASAGELPAAVLPHIPPALAGSAEIIFHRLPVAEYPLLAASRAWIEGYERDLLRRYAETASLVLTPLLHVASPCLGLNIPVILCRKDRDSRFGFIGERIPIHTPDGVAEIDWNPGCVNIVADAAMLVAHIARAIGADPNGFTHRGLP